MVINLKIISVALLVALGGCAQKGLPHEKEVREFLSTLRYSAIDDLLRENVSISLDFSKQQWTLKNIFAYDSEGKLLNHKMRSGVCTQLSEVTYDFTKSLFGQDYRVSFLSAYEGSFFPAQGNIGPTHYLIKATPKNGSQAIFIDPSYKKFGHEGEFRDYKFLNELSSLSAFDRKETGITLPVSHNYPIILSKDGNWILSMVAAKINENFNKDNFAILVRAVKKYEPSGKAACLVFIRKEGKEELYTNKELTTKILGEAMAEKFLSRMLSLFKNISM